MPRQTFLLLLELCIVTWMAPAADADSPHRELALRASLPTAEGARLFVSDPLSLEVGRAYELSCSIRTEGLAPAGRAYLDMASLPATIHSRAVGDSGDGARVSLAFIATAPSDRIRCVLEGGPPSGKAWFDDVRLEPRETPALLPEAVERYGPGYRFHQAGWTCVHIEGEPYERGYQHGHLLWREIVESIDHSARVTSSASPEEAWKWIRLMADSLFLRRSGEELLLEMKGIADGAAERGARREGRPVDLLDIVALNAWIEVSCLAESLGNTPTGLEGRTFSEPFPRAGRHPRVDRCSAFAATGPATTDGKIVFGHITMFDLYVSHDYRIMLDVKPKEGHRLLFQGYPGAVQSGMDYFQNDAGVLIEETTIGQGPFDPQGTPEFVRARRAAQYAESIDDAVRILRQGNNGLYANEWLIGDAKTDEIAMLELGTRQSKLWRSSRNEWPGGTAGFYWGCNNTKDEAVRSEYMVDPKGKPEDLLFVPTDRDRKWLELYGACHGKINARFGALAFSTPPLCAEHALDAKVTTSDMARRMMCWAHFGRPNGRTWEPASSDRKRHGDVEPLVSSGWTVIRFDPSVLPAAAPEMEVASAAKADGKKQGADRPDGAGAAPPEADDEETEDDEDPFEKPPADPPGFVPPWKGTILPAGDADLWLSAGWGSYYRAVEAERKAAFQLEKKETAGGTKGVEPPSPERGTKEAPSALLHRKLGGLRAEYLAAAGAGDRRLDSLRFDYGSDVWHRFAEGKGGCVLHELRRALGDETFFKLVRSAGEELGGKKVSSGELRKRAEAAAGKDLGWFFEQWTGRTGAPRLALEEVRSSEAGGKRVVEATIRQSQEGPAYRLPVEVALETEKGEERKTVWLEGPVTAVRFDAAATPRRLAVDPDGDHLLRNAGGASVTGYLAEPERILIVYGTLAEEAANRFAADLLRRRFLEGWWQLDLPVRSDVEVTPEELKSHHLLIVGRPETNQLAASLAGKFPIAFQGGAFQVAEHTYAGDDCFLLQAAPNPSASGLSLVLFAGLGPRATAHAVQTFPEGVGYAVYQGKKRVASGWLQDPVLSHRF